MTRRMLLILLALILFSVPALAADPVVSDSALVLNDDTIRDSATLNRRLQDAANVSLALVTRHFLDGGQPQPSAEALLNARADKADAVLLLLVIGEERFAVAVGENVKGLLPAEAIASLTSARLMKPFLERAYDKAVGDFLVGLARQIGSAAGEAVNTQDLFGAQTPPPAPSQEDPHTGITEWLERIRPRSEDGPQGSADTGISIGKVVFILAALYFIFGRGSRKGRRGGCSSLIWVVVILSIAGAFDFLK